MLEYRPVPGHGHQPAGCDGLGDDDAVLLGLPHHDGVGEVRRRPTVPRHCAARRDSWAGRELCLPAGAQGAPAPT